MRILVTFIVLACAIAGTAAGQVPDKFTNLKVLPKDIGKQELMDTMKGFSAALGVRCTACHVQAVPGDFSSFDFASDTRDEKGVTRNMMKMVAKLNGEILPAATGEDDAQVSCVTCHRGLINPRTLDQVLLKVAAREGAEAAATRYRELRETYYGTGSYDFSPATLLTVAGTLAEGEDLDGARRLAELNLEMDPDKADGHLLLARIQLAGGDKAAALTSVDRALAIDPENHRALQLRQQLAP